MPQNRMKKLDCGYYDHHSNGSLLAVAWKDRQMVYFAIVSTAHVATNSNGTVIVFRHRPFGVKLEIPCPPLLDDYTCEVYEGC